MSSCLTNTDNTAQNHGPTTSLYYRDPDGNQIETQVDNFDTLAEIDEFIKSPTFEENPIGVDFDPDELCKRIDSGESEESIKKRADVGPSDMDEVKAIMQRINAPVGA